MITLVLLSLSPRGVGKYLVPVLLFAGLESMVELAIIVYYTFFSNLGG